ncbi:glycosyl transferase family 41-domain-containing protein, partial [Ochromonadaceae sp. CCMP2298]
MVALSIWIAFLFCSCNAAVVRSGACSGEALYVHDLNVRERCEFLVKDSKALLSFLEDVECAFGTLFIDDELPSLYNYKGVALFDLRRVEEAGHALNEAVRRDPDDLRAWMNLAQIRMVSKKVGNLHDAIENINRLTGTRCLLMQFKTADWRDLEAITVHQEGLVLSCLHHQDGKSCLDTPITGVEFTYLDGALKRQLYDVLRDVCVEDVLTRAPAPPPVFSLQPAADTIPKLNIGFLFANVDGGPVYSLSRSLVKRLDRRRVKVVAFLLDTDAVINAEWMPQYLRSFDEIYSLNDLNETEAALFISSKDTHVLLDTNGFSLLSGLHVLSHRPSPVQGSFLGDPMTAASPFIDFYLGDAASTPPDVVQGHFGEKLALLPTCYLANSHRDALPDVPLRPRASTYLLLNLCYVFSAEKMIPALEVDASVEGVLFGAFHGYLKFEPAIFRMWMGILRRVPGSKIVLMLQLRDRQAMQNLIREAQVCGIAGERLLFLSQTRWFEHLHVKSAIDLFLDTVIKSGHTTSVDAAWAGLPAISLAGLPRVPSRSGEAIALAADNEAGLVYSLKDYEELAVTLTATAMGRQRLQAWRQHTERARSGRLFDAHFYSGAFVHTLLEAYEVRALSASREAWCRAAADAYACPEQQYHVFQPAAV